MSNDDITGEEEILLLDFDDEDLEDLPKTWLDRMHGFLKWEIIAPRPRVPYGKALSNAALKELSKKKAALYSHIQLRAVADGDELVTVRGLDPHSARFLSIESDHPNISSLMKTELYDYFQRRGLFEWMDKELDQIQREYAIELKRREIEARKNKKFL